MLLFMGPPSEYEGNLFRSQRDADTRFGKAAARIFHRLSRPQGQVYRIVSKHMHQHANGLDLRKLLPKTCPCSNTKSNTDKQMNGQSR
jgi:hypothetical protein